MTLITETHSFKKNDLVLVYKPFRKIGKSEKLLHRWLGPFKVLRQTTPVNYKVQLESGRGKTDIVHVVRMKPFFETITVGEPEDTAQKKIQYQKKRHLMPTQIPYQII